jgi:hypothetical protein
LLRHASRQLNPRPRDVPPPLDAPELLDCDIELAALKSLVAAAAPGVVVVSGPNGSGKTALVRRIPGAIYVDAARLSAAGVLQRVYECAFVNDPPCAPSAERLHKLLESRRIPIVIDDFRGTAEELRALIETLKNGVVVYTAVDAELIDPSAAELRLTGLRAAAARELFERAAGHALPDDDPVLGLLSGPLEGNPLLILQAGALARGGKLPAVQSPAAMSAAIFNGMTIGEQQVFATVSAFNGARPDRTTVEVVSGVANAAGVINALVARSFIESDGEHLWISPLMFSVTGVAPSLMRWDVLFDYLDSTLAQNPLPKSVLSNPEPFLAGLRFEMSKGRHPLVMTTGRALSDALLLAGDVAGARQAAELVRESANEVRDQGIQGWAAHQLGTLSALAGDQADAVTWLETAVTRRDRLGDEDGMHRSLENLALVRGEPSPAARRARKRAGVGRDFGIIAGAMGATALGVAAYALIWLPAHSTQARSHHESHAVVAAHPASHAAQENAPHVASVSPTKRMPHVVASHAARAPGAAIPSPAKVVALIPAAVAAPLVITPLILRFSAAPAKIVAGQTATLCYDVRDASSARLDPGGPVAPGTSCARVHPQRSTHYVLTVSHGGKSAVATLALNVAAAPVPRPRILHFTTTARHIIEGQYAQLCFTLSHATTAVLEPLGQLSSSRSGCLYVSPRIDTYYTLYARNAVGVVARTIHVAVTTDDILNH